VSLHVTYVTNCFKQINKVGLQFQKASLPIVIVAATPVFVQKTEVTLDLILCFWSLKFRNLRATAVAGSGTIVGECSADEGEEMASALQVSEQLQEHKQSERTASTRSKTGF
jgi:hypothetical protein